MVSTNREHDSFHYGRFGFSGSGLKTPQKHFLSVVNRGFIHIIEKKNQLMLLTRTLSQYSSSKLRKFSIENLIDHFTVAGLISQPLSKREAKVDLVLMQTSFFS